MDYYLATKIYSNLIREEQKKKESFWASDAEKSAFDIYHKFMGTPETNPPDGKTLWRFKCGELAEDGVVEALKKEDLIEHGGDEQLRVELQYQNITITGKVDIILKDGNLFEAKSFYGPYMESDFKKGIVKTNYLKQLATYLYALKKAVGYLFMVPMPMGEFYQFQLVQYAPGKFRCNDIEFDLIEEFDRWVKIYNENVLPKKEPVCEYRYKYPIEEIDWSKISKADITKARNGHKVIGDWQVLYSPYKKLIIEREGTKEGYSAEEMALIKELTKGYSSK